MVEPVVKSLVLPEELEEILVTVDAPPSGVGSVIVRVRARGEWILACAGSWGFTVDYRLWDAEAFAADLDDSLPDELVESTLSWGQWRDGGYEVLGPQRN